MNYLMHYLALQAWVPQLVFTAMSISGPGPRRVGLAAVVLTFAGCFTLLRNQPLSRIAVGWVCASMFLFFDIIAPSLKSIDKVWIVFLLGLLAILAITFHISAASHCSSPKILEEFE